MEFIGCTAMYLPPETAVLAAETAIRQNPVNRPMTNSASGSSHSVLSPDHLAVLTGKYWGAAGVRLTVGFLEQTSNAVKNRILKYANLWNQYGNVEFVPTTTDPQIRITLSGQGYWSYLGTDILHIPRNEPTMCLQAISLSTSDSECERVIPHEFGHTCGFPHEHMRSQIIRRIDSQKAIAYFRQTQGWSAAMVQQQVLTPLAESSIMSTPDADETSIMTYSLPGLITTDGRPIVGGSTIAPQDIDFVGKIYPKTNVPPPPPDPAAGKGLDLSMDFERKVMSVRLPAGWTVAKKTATEGVVMQVEFALLADELEAALPPQGKDLDEAKQAAVGGIIGKVLELIAALRAQDIKAVTVAVRDLLNIMLGDAGNGGISFGAHESKGAAAFNFNWKSLIGVLLKLLPTLLGA